MSWLAEYLESPISTVFPFEITTELLEFFSLTLTHETLNAIGRKIVQVNLTVLPTSSM